MSSGPPKIRSAILVPGDHFWPVAFKLCWNACWREEILEAKTLEQRPELQSSIAPSSDAGHLYLAFGVWYLRSNSHVQTSKICRVEHSLFHVPSVQDWASQYCNITLDQYYYVHQTKPCLALTNIGGTLETKEQRHAAQPKVRDMIGISDNYFSYYHWPYKRKENGSWMESG